jgi:amino acid adenylation domain-containing protein/thioester reductase-like protein
VAAHPTLFTRIELDEEGNPVQVVDNTETFSLALERTEDIGAEVAGFIRPYELLGERLFRVRLLRDQNHFHWLLDMHHIIADGGSWRVLLADLDKAYAGEPLEREALTLADVARAEAERMQSPAYEDDKKWHAEHFDCRDCRSPLLPDREEEERKEGLLTRVMDTDPARVDAFCKANGIYRSTFFTAAYAFLLAKFTGEEEVLFSTIHNGRGDKRLRSTVGMLVRTFPVHATFGDDTTVLDFLKANQEQTSGCRAHAAYPYADIVHDLGLRSETLFAWHGDLFDNERLCGKPMKASLLCNNSRECPLYIKAFVRGGRCCVEAEYSANELSEELIGQFLASYEAVLEGFLREERLRDIETALPAQVELLDGFNRTEDFYDDTQTVVSLFRRQAAATPGKTAVVFKDRRYTYAEVDAISDRLAGLIASKGLGAEDVVAILIPRCEWMAIAPLGVLKAGCAFQPLDPTYPKERLDFMLRDSGARLLLADGELRSLVDGYEGEVVPLDDPADLPDSAARPREPGPGDLFTLIYTSGSTGTPKGGQTEHGNWTAFCHMHRKKCGVTADSRVGVYASFGFDASLLDMVPALTAGAEVHIIPEELRLNLVALNGYFERNGITHAFMTTQVAYQFATGIENRSLQVLETGGEKLASLAPPKGYRLLNVYGPSETTCYVTAFWVDAKWRNIPIGPAVANCKLYVVDKHGHRLPAGACGELWIAGPQVGWGYLNQPAKTAATYIANPFCAEGPYARAYKSGDIVRYRPDGNIEFVGRKDGQVKIRGFRIELKEVECVIREFPGIKDATEQAFDEEGGGKFIAAYVVGDGKIDVAALERFILDRKPPYMVPAATMQLDAIPLTQNQKVDKRALPKPVKSASAEEAQTQQAPLNVLEKELHEMAAAIVGNDDFGITTILGHAGLTSISAIRLAVQVNKRYGTVLDPKALVKDGTLQGIENEILKTLLSAGAPQEANPAPVAEPADATRAPLSHAQLGVCYECMKHPLDTTYNIPFMLSFPPGTEADAVERTLVRLVKVHPAFSIHFETNGDDVVQVADPAHVPQIARSRMDDADLEAHAKAFPLPFHLERGPLYRMEIVQTESRLVLLADVHHLIFDGASTDLFVRQLCRLLEGGGIEGEACGYLQFARDQRQRESGEEYQRAKAHFAEVLKACDGCTEVPDDFTPPVAHGRIAHVVRPFDFARVERFCRGLNVTPASFMLAAAFYTLSCYAGTRDVYIATISSGRSDLSLSDTTGMFVNTLPLAGHVTAQTVEEFIRRTSRGFEEAMRHEQYPFARIAADHAFAARTTYSYQLGVLEDYAVGGRKVGMELMEPDVPKQKLDVIVCEQQGQPVICLEYDDAFYAEKTMEGMAESLATVLERFMEASQGSLTAVSMLSAEQERRIDSFRLAGTAEVPNRLFHGALEAQAARKPDAKALVACDGTYTYAQLNAEMNRVAHALVARGVKRGDRVAMLLPRTSRLVIAMFGIMKAGAAYIPCDPHYPVDRIKLILEDSGAACIVTDAANLAALKAEAGGAGLDVLEKALDIEELLQCPDTANPGIPQDGSDLAYIIYTSGSTGRPKGVLLHHRGVCNELFAHPLNFRNWTVVHEVECILGLATISFDASVEEIGLPLTNGLVLALAGDGIANDPNRLAEFMLENNVGMFQGTPSRLMQLRESEAFRKALANCRIIELGGEKFTDAQLHELQKTTSAHIFNSYGPTETTVESNCHEVTREARVSIGRPLANVTEYIVDADLNRVPVGVTGELLVGGAQVALGYNNLPEKTREAFVPNPFAAEGAPDPILYRTGDRARWDGQGFVTILGRNDNQIKLRGLRIELGEIESAIAKQDGIGQVAVAIRKINGKEHLCAYFTADRPVDVESLKTAISKTLTRYMVPTAYLQLDRMPTTPSGKTDLKALPEPVLSARSGYEEPVGALERRLCGIFAAILQVDRVGATDDFFELGGTSLVVTRLIIELDKIGCHLAYGAVFDNPTPRKIAALLAKDHPAAEAEAAPEPEIADYDYSAIDRVLAAGTFEAFRNGTPLELGRVLLTGATGYLGIHLLHELLQSGAAPITCLVRGATPDEAKHRLQTLLYYYFSSACNDLFESGRLSVVAGDVTQEIPRLPVDTVFNCAAVVKHFSKDGDIERVNVDGTRRCIDFCLATGARLVHVSTVSIGGFLPPGTDPAAAILDERTLYLNQHLGNRYTLSKFLSERLVLEAVAEKGLSAKIMRVGNLAARSTDGEFQVNFRTNAFAGMMRAHGLLGCCPYGDFTNPVEFSPIDEAARAIRLLAATPRECCLFHPCNNHAVFLGDVLQELASVGKPVRLVERDEFKQAFERASADPVKAERLQTLVAYTDLAPGQSSVPVQEAHDHTMQILYRLGFHWSPTSWDYVDRFFRTIADFGFFDD